MTIRRKIQIIDLLSLLLFFVMVSGALLILTQDNFQFFFNIRLLAFVGILGVLGIILMRKRQDYFAETL